MKYLTRTIFLLALLILPQAIHAQALDREEVLNRLVESYGGAENLRKLDNAVQEWDMVAIKSKRHGSDIRHIRIPGQLVVMLIYPGKTETRILKDDEGMVSFDDGEPFKATPPQRDAMRLQLMRLYSPLVLRDKSEAVTLTIDGDYCALTLDEHGVRADYLVNMDTWRIEKVAGTLNFSGTPMRFLTEYSEFEFEEGVLVHHKENKFAGNVNTAMLKLRKVTFGGGLEGDSF